jgi:hypothetical protein
MRMCVRTHRYVRMDMIPSQDPKEVQECPGEHHHSLTSHISPAVLPPSVLTVVGTRETPVLDHVMMGQVHNSSGMAKIERRLADR